MPGGDRTGPLGMGPMTGRAAGYCAVYPTPEYANPMPGRGFGMGFGRRRGGGRGWWNRWNMPLVYYPQQTEEQEKGFLENEMKVLQEQLNSIKKRLDEVSAK